MAYQPTADGEHEWNGIKTGLADDVVRAVEREARSLDMDDDRVTVRTGEAVDVSELMIETLLFTNEPYRSTDDGETVTLYYHEGATFPEGDGGVTVRVTADSGTLDVVDVTVTVDPGVAV